MTERFHLDQWLRISRNHPHYPGEACQLFARVYYLNTPQLWVRLEDRLVLIEESMLSSRCYFLTPHYIPI